MFGSALSLLSGLGRESVIAARFGASGLTDTFLVAYAPLDFLLPLAGALSSAFLPVFISSRTKDGDRASWAAFSSIFNLVSLSFLLLGLVGILFAGQLVSIFAPGFSPEKTGLTANLFRIMALSMVGITLMTLLAGTLNSLNKFLAPSLASFVQNSSIIICVLWLSPFWGIYGPAVGVSLGTLAAVAGLIALLIRQNLRYFLTIDWHDPGVRQVLAAAIPLLSWAVMMKGYVLIDRNIGSGLPEGSISALNYARILDSVPINLVLIAISLAVYPTLVRLGAEKQLEGLKGSLIEGTRLAFFLILPTTLFLVIFSQPIISVLFQRGAFDENAARMTQLALVCYAVGIFGWAAQLLCFRALWAMGQVWLTPVITLISLGVNLVLAVVLANLAGYYGLALANSAAMTAAAVLAFLAVRKNLGTFAIPKIARFLTKILIAGAIAGGLALLCFEVLKTMPWPQVTPILVMEMGMMALLAGASYLGLCRLLGNKEARLLLDLIQERLPGRTAG